jgi:hypothetical protein
MSCSIKDLSSEGFMAYTKLLHWSFAHMENDEIIQQYFVLD